MSAGIASENPLQGIIAKAILDRLRNKAKESRPRPTIDELEKMLNEDNPPQVDLLPDGSLTVELPVYASDLADSIIRAIYANGYAILPKSEHS